jgi:uncharacterized protein (TIGR04255 family)
MPLPDAERVIYQRNPLVEVVSQLRFPQILKIIHQDPVDFQDAIRAEYPILEISRGLLVIDSTGGQAQGASYRDTADAQKVDTTYFFKSDDLQWQVSLSGSFIALSTKNYKQFEDFRHRFKAVLDVFERIYKPSFYSRIGLRYQDLIVRSSLGLEGVTWSDLIQAHIAPELQISDLADMVIASTKTLVMQLGTGQVAFRHGLVEAKDEENRTEPAYLLDADFFSEERVGVGNYVWERLNEYNQSARKLFRWSITDRLHMAMEPLPAASQTASNE